MADMIVQLFAQFDVILIAIMLSGLIVKMGKSHGTIIGDSHFKGFYILFFALIFENILIVLLTNYFFLPIFENALVGTYLKVIATTISLILICNIWFAWTFNFRQRIGIIALTVVSTFATIFVFIYA